MTGRDERDDLTCLARGTGSMASGEDVGGYAVDLVVHIPNPTPVFGMNDDDEEKEAKLGVERYKRARPWF